MDTNNPGRVGNNEVAKPPWRLSSLGEPSKPPPSVSILFMSCSFICEMRMQIIFSSVWVWTGKAEHSIQSDITNKERGAGKVKPYAVHLSEVQKYNACNTGCKNGLFRRLPCSFFPMKSCWIKYGATLFGSTLHGNTACILSEGNQYGTMYPTNWAKNLNAKLLQQIASRLGNNRKCGIPGLNPSLRLIYSWDIALWDHME